MRIPRRTLVVGAVGVAVALALTACGPSNSPAPSSSGGKPSGTLQIAHWDFLAPNYGQQMQDIIKGYEKYNPKATIETVGIVRADYETKLKIQLSAGGGPDLFTMADTFLPTVAAANLLEPLDNVLTPTTKKALNSTNKGGVYNNKQVAVTWQIAPYAFLWNKDILAQAGVKPPTTFDELVDAAVTIKQKLGITGFAVRSRLAEETPWWVDFNNWIQGYGGSWSDGKKLTIDSPQNVAALTAFKKMYDSGAFSVGDDASTFRTKFSEGQVAMMIDATGAPPAMISAKVPSTSMISSPLPFPKPYTSQVGIYFGINAHTKNKALAEDFLNWFLTKDTQQALSENLGNTSTLATKTTVSDEFLAKNPWAVGYREDGENTRSSVIRGFESVTPQIAHTVLSQVEKVLLQDVSPQRALSDAASSLK
ncbi:sugar ABC transporter substrate-binding protein [Pseudolysinimonas kribbensis]|uniref:Sugar ABC transporter n=1 Tax=Pseudolysinimonas kribbensis TaxID=433641 RepID=A0ABQ6K9K1_9MICO|nr:sugar ABC transporter substrate-binding protein [Pseudolysinimonas kribbensis]GMA95391.1 sugar ABC transporter [Pseudolysinimonas kribbensis]